LCSKVPAVGLLGGGGGGSGKEGQHSGEMFARETRLMIEDGGECWAGLLAVALLRLASGKMEQGRTGSQGKGGREGGGGEAGM